MPPSLETSLSRERTPLFKKPLVQTRLVFGDGVVSRPANRSQVQSPARSKVERRTYADGPLPFKPSQDAPRDARIVGRVAELGKLPYFTLKVGDVEVDDVGLHEILEYVSPYELERFEHQQFVEERDALAAALAAAELEEEMRRERRMERAKRKGIIVFEELDADDADSADANAASGKFGRARPTYKHLFKVPQERRRRRKRDPVTGELLPLSDDEVQGVETMNLDSSEEDLSRHEQRSESSVQAPKRRRRRRDPQTGELLPLPPLPQKDVMRTGNAPASVASIASDRNTSARVQHTSLQPQKRPRRRRHPLTGELMPLGWKYEPDMEESSHQARPEGMSPSMRKLSISQEQQAKRVKVASESSADELLRQATSETTTTKNKPVLHDFTQSAALRNTRSPVSSPAKSKSTPKTSMLRPIARTESSASSTEPVTLASFLKTAAAAGPDDSDSDDSLALPLKPAVRNTPTQGKTSIMQPVAADPSSSSDEDENDDNSSLHEGEWFVEAIIGHKMSDPKSHPGKKSVMLYHTKWEGSDELTWEPAESFVDADTVMAYRVQAGLDKPKQTSSRHEDAAVKPSHFAQTSDIQTSDSGTDDGWEVDRILAHHMSDPRTHPGRPQTLLYKVKWVGFPESKATWEPKSSFPDPDILSAYRAKVGLRGTP